MTLAELLAANPTVQAEHDTALGLARTEGMKTAKEKMKAKIDKVRPILASPDYPAAIKDFGIKVITGEGEVATFDALIVIEDQRIEKEKAAAAEVESKKAGETPGAGGAGGDAAEVSAAFKAKKERMKEGV